MTTILEERHSDSINPATGKREVVDVRDIHHGITTTTTKIYDSADDVRPSMVLTDYRKGDYMYRVVDFRSTCSIGRQNAEMFQLLPNGGKTSTFKYVDRAHARAIELLLDATA